MELTEREQIQLTYLAEHTKQTRSDYKRAYLYSRETSFSKATLESLDAMIEHFRRRKEVQQFVEDITRENKAEQARRIKAEVDKILKPAEQNENGSGNTSGNTSNNGTRGNEQITDVSALRTNFENRSEFIRYLNERANTIADENQRLQLLKMLADLLRLKEDTPNEENDIQRFYTPLKCNECPLYRNNVTQ